MSRTEYVRDASIVFYSIMGHHFQGLEGVRLLEKFLVDAERAAHIKSRATQDRLRAADADYTEHASHMRSVNEYLGRLKTYVAALQRDSTREYERMKAIGCVAFIQAELQAMDIGLD